ncbi:MAG: glycine betaine ABC transporter substrate-binding protein [Egibacteraceae bacterium]
MKSVFVRLTTLLAVLALVVTACGDDGDDVGGSGGTDEDEGSIAADYDLSGASFTVGSKDFTEQLILGQIAIAALEAAGASVTDQTNLGGTVVARQALESGDIDLYWDYNGTGWIEFLGETEVTSDGDALYEQVREADLEENGIVWYEPAPLNNTYALAQSQEAADEFGVTNLTEYGELVESSPDDATLCIESEFESRDDGLPGMEEHYGYDVPTDIITVLDIGPVYQATADRDPCNFGEVFASDGRIAALDLTVLEDDQGFFPPYNPSVTVREETHEEHGDQLSELFAEIANALDLETMQELNARRDVEDEFEEDIAREWLQENGFIG